MANETEKTEDKGEYKPEYEIIEQGAEGAKPDDKKEAKPAGYADDERLSSEQRADDEGEGEDDTEVKLDDGTAPDPAEVARRDKRKRERKAQKERHKRARESSDRELGFLRTRNEQLERRFGHLEQRLGQNEAAAIEGRMNELKAAQAEAEEVLAKAIDAGNGSDVVKLTKTLETLKEGQRRLSSYKAKLEADAAKAEEAGETEGEQTPQRQAAAPATTVKAVRDNLAAFAKRHSWFNPESGDEDSEIVKAIDNGVLRDGYHPATKDYWIELEDRMKRRLPERMKSFGASVDKEADDDLDDDDTPPARNGGGKPANGKSGPRMSQGSTTRGNGRQFLLSAERKQALIEAGVWDDPKLRDSYIAQYVKYDKENPPQSGR